jgi:hypothetical protein
MPEFGFTLVFSAQPFPEYRLSSIGRAQNLAEIASTALR